MSYGSASRVHSRSLKDEFRKGSNWSPPVVDESVVRDVMQKLNELPEYSACGKSEKHSEALKLTSTSEMKKCFSDYLHERNRFLLVPQQQSAPEEAAVADPSSSAEATPIEVQHTLEETLVIEDENREILVQWLSDFSVKIHITSEKNAIQMALQVGDQVIEWTALSVVKPHKNIPSESLFSLDLSDCLMKTLTSREAQGENSEVDDCVLKLVKARTVLIEHVVKQIILFNRYYYYDATARDSQSFLRNIMATLKLDSLPHLTSALSSYITDLRNCHDILPAQDHTDMDSYVTEHVEEMKVGMMEHMALLYYQHHLDSRAKAQDAGSETWKCPEGQCQFTNLLVHLNKHHNS